MGFTIELSQFELEQRMKRLETRMEIAIRNCQWNEADAINDELYATSTYYAGLVAQKELAI